MAESSRFTAAEGGARLAGAARARNTIAADLAAFTATRLLHERAHMIRGPYSSGKHRSVYVTRASRVPCVTYELTILTDLATVQAVKSEDVGDWRQELEVKEVLVCTAPVLRQLLEEKILDMTRINVLVVDSCHLVHTDPDLQIIMDHYKTSPARPRVLGLTYPFFSSKRPNSEDKTEAEGEKDDSKYAEPTEDSQDIGIRENLDDFEMYRKLEWNIEQLESKLCCHMDLAEDIDGGKRFTTSTTKPKELIVEYASGRPSSSDCRRLDTFMRDAATDVMGFLDEHRYDPTEIYGDELYEEFKNIPDPTIDPKRVFKEFLYVLDELGPYGADKAAFTLLTRLEKLKIKVPYERHFLLLCLCTTVLVKIRCYADQIFSNYSDFDRITTFSTPKVLRFIEILAQFENHEDDNDKNESDNKKSIENEGVSDNNDANISHNVDCKGDDANKDMKTEITNVDNEPKNTIVKEMEIDELDKFENHGDENDKNESENKKSIENEGVIDNNDANISHKDNANKDMKTDITHIDNEPKNTNVKEMESDELDKESENINDIDNKTLESHNDSSNMNGEEIDEQQINKINAKKMLKDIEQCDFITLSNKIEDKVNTYEANLKEIDNLNKDLTEDKDESKVNNETASENESVAKDSKPDFDPTDPRSLLGIPRRLHRSRGRGKIQRNVARSQQMMQNPDALCGIVFMNEPIMAKIMFLLVADLSRSSGMLSFVSAQYVAAAGAGADPAELRRHCRAREDALKKFRMHDCNLLLATSELEEGIDLPRCNLVLRWDIPPSYRSHGLCRGRARAPRASCVLLACADDRSSQTLLRHVAVYRELDQIISRKCGCGIQDEPPQQEENHADIYTPLVLPYSPFDNAETERTSQIVDEKEGDEVERAKDKEEKTKEDVIEKIDDDILNVSKIINAKDDNVKRKEASIVIDRKDDTDINEITDASEIKIRKDSNNTLIDNKEIKDSKETVSDINCEISDTDSKTNLVCNKCGKKRTSIDEECCVECKSGNLENDGGKKDDIQASVDLSTAIALINRYCGKLPSDTFTRLAPSCRTERVHVPAREGHVPAWVCTLRLPLNCPVKYNIVGHPMPTRVLARRMAALQACRILHKSGELDDHLMPIGKENFKAAELDDTNAGGSPDARPGTTKRRQYYYKRTARAFTDCEPIVDTTDEQLATETDGHADKSSNVLYAISCTLWCALPERYNTRGRKLHAPQHAAQAIGILVRRHSPDRLQLPAFPVYTRSGEVRVSVSRTPGADTRLSPRRAALIMRFMRFVFSDVLRVRRRGMTLQSDGTTHNNYYVVPTVKVNNPDGSTNVDIDWNFLEEIYQYTEDKYQDEMEKPTLWPDEDAASEKREGDSEKREEDSVKREASEKREGDSEKREASEKREEDSVKREASEKREGDSEKREASEKREENSVKREASEKREGDSEKREASEKREGDSEKREGDSDVKMEEDSEVKRDGVLEGTSDTKRKGTSEGTKERDSEVKQETTEKKGGVTSKGGDAADTKSSSEAVASDTKLDESGASRSKAAEGASRSKQNVEAKPDIPTQKRKSQKFENPLLRPGEVFVFDADKYREAVVTPWYRNRDQPQFFLVAEICFNLTPDSAFPSNTHTSFREYYRSKYGVTLTQSNQPLLDVDHTSARLNLLTPRYVNRKGVALPVSSERTRRAKRDHLDQKQILVPELCCVHPFAAPLWSATVALPCVLYRINALLIADEIRRGVARGVALGVARAPDTPHQWPPLDFGWSLAEVLSADSEKNEKKKENSEEIKEADDVELKEKEEQKQTESEEPKEKTINDILQEKEDAESGFEIGTWDNKMASSIPTEYDEFMEPLPPNLTFCTSASGGANWCDPVQKPKNQFQPSRTFSMADSDCSYMSSDFDTDDSDLNSECSDETETSGFCSIKSNTAMGVRIEYKTAHEAEAVDLERQKTHPAPQPDDEDDERDRASHARLMRVGDLPPDCLKKFQKSVSEHEKEIVENGLLIPHDQPLTDVLPDPLNDSRKPQPIPKEDTKMRFEQLFPYKNDYLNIEKGPITLEDIEKNKRFLLNEFKQTLSEDEIKKLTCFSMIDVDIDSPEFKNEKISNIGFDTVDSYKDKVNSIGSREFKPYYEDGKGLNGTEFDFDYQPNLEGHPGPSPSVILQALTMSNANDGINLERLETIGDSFLKFAITAYLYCAHPTVHEGKLSHMRSKQVSNLNLYRLGLRKRLGARMIASKFEPHDNWLPPCHRAPPAAHAPVDSEELNAGPPQTGCFIPYNLITQHSIPDKSIADCVEALIGAYLLECGPRGALLFMSWLGIRVLPRHLVAITDENVIRELEKQRQAARKPKPRRERVDSETSEDEDDDAISRPVGSLAPYQDEKGQWILPIFGDLKAPPSPLLRYIADPEGELEKMLSGYDALERTLQYRFRDRSLLLQALTHASHHRNRLTDCYQRLELLGDAILDYLITRHLYEDERRHSPGALTDLRSALVNNTIFATLAARHGFHKYFRHMSPGLNEVLTRYVRIQEENGHSISEEHYLIHEDELEQAEDVEVPKALGDLFESIAGAIFLDSGMSLAAVWSSYELLMGAELEAFSAAAPKSPVRELLEAEPDTAKFGKPERLADGRRVRVCVEVFGRGAFKGVGRNYRIAKGTAARCALRHLKRHRQH